MINFVKEEILEQITIYKKLIAKKKEALDAKNDLSGTERNREWIWYLEKILDKELEFYIDDTKFRFKATQQFNQSPKKLVILFQMKLEVKGKIN